MKIEKLKSIPRFIYRKIIYIFQTFYSIRWIKDWFRVKKSPDFLFICHDVDRQFDLDGKLFSQYLDPIAYRLEKQGCSIQRVTWAFSNQNSTQQLFRYKNLDAIIQIPFIGAFIFFMLVGRPKAIITIGWNQKIRKLARRYKVKTIEPIHGFGLGKKDYMYGIGKTNLIIPDLFLAFDNQTYETLSSKTDKESVIRCKHPYIERKKMINELNPEHTYTLQHGYEGTRHFLKGILPNGIIHDDVIKAIKELKDYFWIIKAHPVQLARGDWKQTKSFLKDSFGNLRHVDEDNFNNADITDILLASDLHITMTSGTTTEAAMLGVPSIGLCPNLRSGGSMEDAFEYARSKQLLTVCDLSYNSILDTIHSLVEKKSEASLTKVDLEKIEGRHSLASQAILEWIKIGKN